MPEIIGVKELYKNLKEIARRTTKGESFIVVKRSRPVFRIVPYHEGRAKKYSLKDLKTLQFERLKGKHEKLSGKIDELVYK